MGALKTAFHESWKEFNARQQAARDAWLVHSLIDLDDWYDRLGFVGQQFKAEFSTTQCTEAIDLDVRSRAALNAHYFLHGFMNSISYNKDVLDDPRELFSSKTHEAVHAIQFHRSAATHATAFNAHTKIVLCPRDAILLQELKERDAQSKQWLFNQMLDDYLAAPDGSYVPPAVDVLESLLRGTARIILETTHRYDGQTFLESYRDMTIREYEGLLTDRHRDEGDIIYVRLDPDDIIGVGDSLGLHSFGRNEAEARQWMVSAPLTAAQEGRLSAVHRVLGLDEARVLPTLAEALQAQGLTRAGFVAHSRAKPPESGANPALTPCP